MSARKPKAPRFTAVERAILEPLIVRAVVAAVGLSKSSDARRDAAELAVRSAGKALDRALRKIRGGK